MERCKQGRAVLRTRGGRTQLLAVESWSRHEGKVAARVRLHVFDALYSKEFPPTLIPLHSCLRGEKIKLHHSFLLFASFIHQTSFAKTLSRIVCPSFSLAEAASLRDSAFLSLLPVWRLRFATSSSTDRLRRLPQYSRFEVAGLGRHGLFLLNSPVDTIKKTWNIPARVAQH